MVERFGMQGLLCIFQSLRNRGIFKWEFDLFERQRPGLVDEGFPTKDGACISRHAGPAIGFNFVLAHGRGVEGDLGKKKAMRGV